MKDTVDLKEALRWLRKSPLQSPARLAIMLLLASRDAVEFGELQRLLGLTPGNLWSHIEKLRERGLVEVSYRPRLRQGPRMVVKPTEEGLRVLLMHLRYLRILEALGGLGERGREKETEPYPSSA